jgi:DNA mismatch repair protein MSH6
MARGIEGNEVSTPKPTLKKTPSASQSKNKSSQGQRSILGFFSKQGATPNPVLKAKESGSQLTPDPSSDAAAPSSPLDAVAEPGRNKENGLPSPSSSSEALKGRGADGVAEVLPGSPSRKVRYYYPSVLCKY